MTTLFLTGASGVVGSRVLFDMLKMDEIKIICLAKEKDPALYYNRLLNLMRPYLEEEKNLPFLETNLRNRVSIVAGDVSQKQLGLTSHDYNKVLNQAGIVCHLAAYVNLISPYIKSKIINEQGTENVVELCLDGKIPLLYTSSYSIIGDKAFDKRFIFYEKEPNIGQNFKGLGYQESKFRAENIIFDAADNGLNFQILRIGDVYGEQKRGVYPLVKTTLKGVYYDVFKTVVETGFYWDRDDFYDISPVDVVSKIITSIITGKEINNTVFNAINPSRKTFNQIMSMISVHGYSLEKIPLKKYLTAVREKKLTLRGIAYFSPAINVINYYEEIFRNQIESGLMMNATFDQTSFLNFCTKNRIAFPKVDQKLINTLLDFCIKEKFILNAEEQKHRAEFIK